MYEQIIKYKNYFPLINQSNQLSKTAWVIGNVEIKKNSIISDRVVLRGDGKKITVGKNCIFKNKSTVHVAAELLGTAIGNNCIIGTNTVVHACNLKSNVLVGNNSVIMDESEIGNNVIIGDNCLIAPRKKIPDFSLVKGSPGKIIKILTKTEYVRYKNQLNAEKTKIIKKNIKKFPCKYKDIIPNNFFVAPDLFSTATLQLKENASIWFSTIILGLNGKGLVEIGEGTNVQDNSIINTKGKTVKIGNKVTVGHNVSILGPVTIGDNVVLGMGSVIEEGSVIKDNAFVGANSYLKKNTLVPKDTIFAGSPARFFRKVKIKENFTVNTLD